MKVVINKCFGGFGLSDAAYEKLHEWGIPIKKYEKGEGADNDGEVIFDRELTPADEDSFAALYHRFKPNSIGGRYWDTWLNGSRSHPLLVRLVEEMGAGRRTGASGNYSALHIVEIPDGTEFTIEEYDGQEHIAEVHRTWA